ncbi:hypothetical protein Tco_1093510 [Tanacetum coccineum]|uniref:Uncharacterized protein n=1 Tax=Tanacetum coccineum TaxID=301880 RepID=A0ABQ5IEY6_9ASTR
MGNRHGNSGGDRDGIPRSMRLDVPKFQGSDPESWIFAINEYVTLHATPNEQRDAFALARITEARFGDQWATTTPAKSSSSTNTT